MKLKIIKKNINENDSIELQDSLTFELIDLPSNQYKIVLKKNKKYVGQIVVTEKNSIAFVDFIIVNDFRKKFGTKLYEEAVKEAKRRGNNYFCSDTSRKESSEGFWKKQFDKDKAQINKENDGNTRYCLDLNVIDQIDLSEEIY